MARPVAAGRAALLSTPAVGAIRRCRSALPLDAGREPLFVVTHIDVVPAGREAGAAATAAMTAASRSSPGNLGFDALIQQSRQNHFTVVECWRDEAALLAHAAAPATVAARTALGPLGGSLYDERLYREAG